MLDGDAALEGLTAFLARFRKVLNPLFDGIRKSRDMERCLYEGRTFLWTFIVGHLARLGSRNAMDANRNDPKYADAILKLADQGVWPEGERKTAPCTLSCCNFLSRGFPVQMINLLQHICMVSNIGHQAQPTVSLRFHLALGCPQSILL